VEIEWYINTGSTGRTALGRAVELYARGSDPVIRAVYPAYAGQTCFSPLAPCRRPCSAATAEPAVAELTGVGVRQGSHGRWSLVRHWGALDQLEQP